VAFEKLSAAVAATARQRQQTLDCDSFGQFTAHLHNKLNTLTQHPPTDHLQSSILASLLSILAIAQAIELSLHRAITHAHRMRSISRPIEQSIEQYGSCTAPRLLYTSTNHHKKTTTASTHRSIR